MKPARSRSVGCRDLRLASPRSSAFQRRHCARARVNTWTRSLAGNPSTSSQRRSRSSALPGVHRTADTTRDAYHHGRAARNAIASQPSTSTAACAAVSSLEACPTPALRPTYIAGLAACAGRCPTTLNIKRHSSLRPRPDLRSSRATRSRHSGPGKAVTGPVSSSPEESHSVTIRRPTQRHAARDLAGPTPRPTWRA